VVQTRGKRTRAEAPVKPPLAKAKRGKGNASAVEETVPPLAPQLGETEEIPSETAPPMKGRGKRSSTRPTVEPVPAPVSLTVLVPTESLETCGSGSASADAPPPQSPSPSVTRGKKPARGRSRVQPEEAEVKEGVEVKDAEPVTPLPSRTTRRGSSTAAATITSPATATAISPASSPPPSPHSERVLILLTGYQRDSHIDKLVREINAEITNDPSPLVTHCITTVELKRTPKLLMSLNYGVMYVLTMAWLEDSANVGHPIPISFGEAEEDRERGVGERDDAEAVSEGEGEGAGGKGKRKGKAKGAKAKGKGGKVTGGGSFSKYLICDRQKEKLWNFDLRTTLRRAQRPSSSSSSSSPPLLFSSFLVYVTKGVCGCGAPKEDEMKSIIVSGGGAWLARLPTGVSKSGGGRAGSRRGEGEGAAGSGTGEAERAAGEGERGIIIISSEASAAKEVTPALMEYAKTGPGRGIYSIEFLFLAILRYEVDFETGLLSGYGFS
jgi:hypothetical protein